MTYIVKGNLSIGINIKPSMKWTYKTNKMQVYVSYFQPKTSNKSRELQFKRIWSPKTSSISL